MNNKAAPTHLSTGAQAAMVRGPAPVRPSMTAQSHAANAHVLDAAKIVQTVVLLHARIAERFPKSGLSGVCKHLADIAEATALRVEALSQPDYLLRALAIVAVVAGLVAQVYVFELTNWSDVLRRASAVEIAEGLDSIVNLLVLAAGAIWFVLTLEVRLKRRRILKHLYEFRSLAHVIDMHQLTKDPSVVMGGSTATASSPQRRMSEFELSRYLNYCSEMLALISKLAALYAGRTQDDEVISAVNELEELTSDLGRKIWQKIMIINQYDERHGELQRRR